MSNHYTVFCEESGSWFNNCPLSSGSDFAGVSLDRLIALAAAYHGGRTPQYWAAEATSTYGGTKDYTTLRLESIAAGRTIELIDGRYVARGVPIETGELTQGCAEAGDEPETLGSILRRALERNQPATKTPTLDKLEAERKFCDALARDAADDLNAAMIARDGAPAPSKPRDSSPSVSTAKPSIPGLTMLGDVADPLHGSAFLRR